MVPFFTIILVIIDSLSAELVIYCTRDFCVLLPISLGTSVSRSVNSWISRTFVFAFLSRILRFYQLFSCSVTVTFFFFIDIIIRRLLFYVFVLIAHKVIDWASTSKTLIVNINLLSNKLQTFYIHNKYIFNAQVWFNRALLLTKLKIRSCIGMSCNYKTNFIFSIVTIYQFYIPEFTLSRCISMKFNELILTHNFIVIVA